MAPEVVAYSGAAAAGGAPFSAQLARFTAFDPSYRGGVNVAAGDVDGGTRDNIIVGSGPDMDSTVTVFSSQLPPVRGAAPAVFASFSPYPGSRSGVTLATGLVEPMSGRPSIVTAPGPGEPAVVKVFRYDLFFGVTEHGVHDPKAATKAAELSPFDASYTGGVSLATGWLAGAEGGVQRIIVGQLSGPGAVKVFSSGSALTGEPTLYLLSPADHTKQTASGEIASFSPFGGGAGGAGAGGARVATTSTVTGAELIVAGGAPGAGTEASVRRYSFARSSTGAPSLTPTEVGSLPAGPGPAGPVAGG
jgi:hypothetical protein